MYFIAFVILLLGANFGTRIVNNYYREKIIDQENREFIELFIHMIEFSTEDNALTLVEHYSHTNNAGIVIYKDENLFYRTEKVPVQIREYDEIFNGVDYSMTIDNSRSYVAIIRDSEVYWINVILFSSFSVAVMYFVYSRRRRGQKTVHDLKLIQDVLENRDHQHEGFHFKEFHQINDEIIFNLRTIDLLTQKRFDNINGLVHDLKTPITILKHHIEEETNFVENKDAIIQSLNDLTIIASDLVSEKYHGDHRALNLSVLVVNELKKYEPSFLSKNIKLKTKINEDIFVRFNKRNLLRVLQNLLTNAFYYSDSDSIVYINLINNKDSYSLDIINKGAHLSEDQITTIFEKKVSDSNDEKSNGLGLYIARLLVEEAGASISCKSEKDGNRFRITFPMIKDKG